MLNISEKDKIKIEEAVRAAEQSTSSEVVPVLAKSSGMYLHPYLISGALMSVLIGVTIAPMAGTWMLPFEVTVPLFGLILLAGFAIGVGLAFIPLIRRFFVYKPVMLSQVNVWAKAAFTQYGIFKTKARTGILIYISEFERRVVIIGDEGITAFVDQHEWDEAIKLIISGIKNKKTADGIIDGINYCAKLLNRPGLYIEPNDENELGDGLRIQK